MQYRTQFIDSDLSAELNAQSEKFRERIPKDCIRLVTVIYYPPTPSTASHYRAVWELDL